MAYAITITTPVIAETADAILVQLDEFDPPRKEWIPKGQIDDDSEVFKKGHTGKFVVADWIAEKKGLI